MRFNYREKREGKIISFSNVITSIIEDLNFTESFIIEKVRIIWSMIVGDIIATHSLPDRIFKKILFIYVDHSVYSNELSLMRDLIIKGINDKLGFEVISNIKIEVKRLNWKKE